MKVKLMLLAVTVLLAASMAYGQATPAPTPAPAPVVPNCVPVNLGVAYVHFAKVDGTMIEAAHPFTDCSKKVIGSVGYVQLLIPKEDTSMYLIGPRGDLPFANSFHTADPVLSKLGLFGGCGIGTAVVNPSTGPQTNHFAYGCQGGLNGSPGSLFGASVQVEIGGGFVRYNGHTLTANTLANASSMVQAAVLFNIGSNKGPSAAQTAANTPVARTTSAAKP